MERNSFSRDPFQSEFECLVKFKAGRKIYSKEKIFFCKLIQYCFILLTLV